MHTALIVCRLVHFWTVLMLFGLCLARMLPGLSLERAVPRFIAARLTPALCLVALLSAVGWLLLTAASMAGNWADGFDRDTLLLVLGNTSFGKIWAWHLGLNLLLLIILAAADTPSPLLRLALAFSLLATLAPIGHVAMFDGLSGQLMILNQLIHLCAVGAWLGGLGLLLSQLRCLGAVAADMRAILLRFSSLGYLLVALIIATGLINVRAMSGAFWPQPALSGFGLILGIKASMVLCMLALALFNRLMLNRRDLPTGVLRTSIIFESLFGVAALLAVSLLGTLPPLQAG
ncbi:copper homeostasis membrane protein CopD [Pseudomonas syringae]|uniref:Copper resistance protein D n=1 Tax=Pseudomonas syringae TaxID=317 RepID=A0A085VMZ9_PSESX|nr:copper homeostasis membrane protein CopD [Pseudomonas syringae]KFE56812.1 copper resistance protein CopD [Pseudomonas syringae]